MRARHPALLEHRRFRASRRQRLLLNRQRLAIGLERFVPPPQQVQRVAEAVEDRRAPAGLAKCLEQVERLAVVLRGLRVPLHPRLLDRLVHGQPVLHGSEVHLGRRDPICLAERREPGEGSLESLERLRQIAAALMLEREVEPRCRDARRVVRPLRDVQGDPQQTDGRLDPAARHRAHCSAADGDPEFFGHEVGFPVEQGQLLRQAGQPRQVEREIVDGRRLAPDLPLARIQAGGEVPRPLMGGNLLPPGVGDRCVHEDASRRTIAPHFPADHAEVGEGGVLGLERERSHVGLRSTLDRGRVAEGPPCGGVLPRVGGEVGVDHQPDGRLVGGRHGWRRDLAGGGGGGMASVGRHGAALGQCHEEDAHAEPGLHVRPQSANGCRHRQRTGRRREY